MNFSFMEFIPLNLTLLRVIFFLQKFHFISSVAYSFFCVFKLSVWQDYPSIFGGRTEDCEEGFEDSEGKRKAGFKELRCH